MEIVQGFLAIFGLFSLSIAVWRCWRSAFDAVKALGRRLPTMLALPLRQELVVLTMIARTPVAYIRAAAAISLRAIRSPSLIGKVIRCSLLPAGYVVMLVVMLKVVPPHIYTVQMAILRGIVTALKIMPRLVATYRAVKVTKRTYGFG